MGSRNVIAFNAINGKHNHGWFKEGQNFTGSAHYGFTLNLSEAAHTALIAYAEAMPGRNTRLDAIQDIVAKALKLPITKEN